MAGLRVQQFPTVPFSVSQCVEIFQAEIASGSYLAADFDCLRDR
ncbi:MAG: hypothetical protein AAGA40_19135 [Cyanobacteria bacterium P01_E01_bin.45]